MIAKHRINIFINLIADDDLTTRYNSDVMDRCNDTHVAMPYNSIANSTSYFEDNNQKARPELSSSPRPSSKYILYSTYTTYTP